MALPISYPGGQWIQQQRLKAKTWATCAACPKKWIFVSKDDLKEHAKTYHPELLPIEDEESEDFLESFAESARDRYFSQLRKFADSQPTTKTSGIDAPDHFPPRRPEDLAKQDPEVLALETAGCSTTPFRRNEDLATEDLYNRGAASRRSALDSNKPRVYCKQCDKHQEGFRGEHELQRHVDREHKTLIKKWVVSQYDPGGYHSKAYESKEHESRVVPDFMNSFLKQPRPSPLPQQPRRPPDQEAPFMTYFKGPASLATISYEREQSPGPYLPGPLTTTSRGIKGKVKGNDIWAFGDTGAAQNIISTRQAEIFGLQIHKSPTYLRMGNSKTVFSPGIVNFPWAFDDSPDKITDITARVLENFKYGVLLGNPFLKATQTLTKHIRRFVKGVFQIHPVMSFNLLGETSHRLDGLLDGNVRMQGLPDTGSSHNMINEAWSKAHGLPILSEPQHCGRVYFPDGSSTVTTGQVHTTITLQGGDAIPIVFEILPDCCVPIVLGADFVLDNNVFSDNADSACEVEGSDFSNGLFLNMHYEQKPWYAKIGEKAKLLLRKKLCRPKSTNEQQAEKIPNDSAEHKRQDIWNVQYQYGKSATREGWEVELRLRESHELGKYPEWRPDPNQPLIRYGPRTSNEGHGSEPIPPEYSNGRAYNYEMFGVNEAALWRAERPVKVG